MACALRLAQLVDDHNAKHPDAPLSKDNIYVLEKAREVGAHCLSGALLDPRSMLELLDSQPCALSAMEIEEQLRESRRPDLAHEFLDYLLRPQVSADIAQSTKTATANAQGRALLPDALRTNPVLYPPPSVLSRGEWPGTLPPSAQRLRDRIWTEIKSA